MSDSARIRHHYASTDIVPRLLAALRAARGPEIPITPEALASIDHFHRGGAVSTRKLATLLAPRAGELILDIGGGIGGPARWIASQFGCYVTCLELVPEFCEAAEELNALVGMADLVRVAQGDAVAMLSEEDESYDRVYSQSALMNVADKAACCREIRRVLKPGGVVAISVVGSGPAGAPHYPLPFASDPETGFLCSPEEMRRLLTITGLEIVSFKDSTAEIVAQQAEHRQRLQTEGLPALGWHVLMGSERSRSLQINAARSFEEGRLVELEILARRID